MTGVTELLRRSERAPASASKTVTAFRFEVPVGTEALTLNFDYGPRESRDREANLALIEAEFERFIARRRPSLGEAGVARHREALKIDERAASLQNLMNVVLIDPAGQWRGRWDRLPAAQFGDLVLSQGVASRGFVAGAIQPGTWTAAVECHGVFGAPVDYVLTVRGRAAPEPGEVTHLAEPRYAEPPRRRSGPGWYFGELHSHSIHSDGKFEMAVIADRAARAGLDFLALTDHNTMSAHPVPAGAPLVMVPGFELTTFHGHHPIYGIDRTIPWHVDGRVVPLAELAPLIRERGGLIGIAHPFVPGDPLCTGCRMVDGLPPDSFDLIEVWYRRWTSPGSDNQAGYELWNRLWAEGHRKTAVAARDWHGPEQEGPFPGELPLTGVFAADSTPGAILDGLRRGRAILSRGPIVDLALVDGSRLGGIGDQVALVDGARLVLSVERLEEPAELRLLASGSIVERWPIEKDDQVNAKSVSPGYYRAELWTGDQPLALTNHIVIE
jgi:hypothetical protein